MGNWGIFAFQSYVVLFKLILQAIGLLCGKILQILKKVNDIGRVALTNAAVLHFWYVRLQGRRDS